MPRLLQINITSNWGSTGRIAEMIGNRVLAEGWSSEIAYGYLENPSNSETLRLSSKRKTRWHRRLAKYLGLDGLASNKATRRLIEEIETTKPDIIHLHNIHGFYLNYKILFEYLATIDTPVVWTLHDCWSFTGHCAHYFECGCDRWMTECHHCPNKATYPKTYVDCTTRNHRLKRKLFTSLGDRLTITPVSQWLEQEASKSFFKESRIKYIYNGIDTTVFAPSTHSDIRQKYSIGDRPLCVSVASVWDAQKGLNEIIALRKQLPEQYALMIVGIAEHQLPLLPDGVIAIPRTQSQKELVDIYSTANVVLSLSRQETFGMTIAEGMACGTPAIVYRTTALPELVTPETGRVVEQIGDIEGLTRAIMEVCQRPKESYVDKCRNRALEFFDKKRCTDNYFALYNELLTKTK